MLNGKRLARMSAMFILLPALLSISCFLNPNEKRYVRNQSGQYVQVTRQDNSYYQFHQDWGCVPADLKSVAKFYNAYTLMNMTQLDIIQRYDLDHSGWMSQYEAAVAAVANGIYVEQITTCLTPDEVLTELYKRVDLNHPTAVGWGFGDNGNTGHLVLNTGYLAEKNWGPILGFYFMDPDYFYSGYRYESKEVAKYLLQSPTQGFYPLTAFLGTNYSNYKPVAEVSASESAADALVVDEPSGQDGVDQGGSRTIAFLRPPTAERDEGGGVSYPPYPDDPIERASADLTLNAQAHSIIGPGGAFGNLYYQYYSNVRFAGAGEVVMMPESPQVPCNRTANYSMPVVDAYTGQLRGAVWTSQVYKCGLPPEPLVLKEYLVKFPDAVVPQKVAAGETVATRPEPLLTYKVRAENPGYRVRSVYGDGARKLGYPTPLFPFVEITDPTTGEVHTYAPKGEEITWNGTEFALVPGAQTYRPMKPIAVQKLTATVAPNPFNPSTTIRFSLPETAPVTVEVFNILGQRVTTLIDGLTYQPGNHAVTFDGRDASGVPLGSGAYFYRITAGEIRRTGQMTLIK